jgi:serine/threonine-protein kinase SRK2
VIDIAQKRGLREEMARQYFQQMVVALDYCHSLGIAMRDIKVCSTAVWATCIQVVRNMSRHTCYKPANERVANSSAPLLQVDNMLLHWPEGATRPVMKLCDFGYSRFQAAACSTGCGTPEYMAPEVGLRFRV